MTVPHVTKTPSLEEIRDYLLSFDRFGGTDNESLNYLKDSLRRFRDTLDMVLQVHTGGGKLLELGAGPYFLTQLLHRYTSYDLDLANYHGEEARDWEHYQQIEETEFHYAYFNAESDPFPYDNGQFDMVLCCELVEHLTVDPTHMLCECHRVLVDGGYLLVTTPNVLRLQNVEYLLRGRNIYDPYSGYGIYGRHNREYAPRELVHLLLECGYEIAQLRLADKYEHPLVLRFLKAIRSHWRDNIYVLARAVGEPRYRYPAGLYRSMYGAMRFPGDKLKFCAVHRVTSDNMVMGKNDVNHLGYGWYELERAPCFARWTGKEANAYLVKRGKPRALCVEASAGPLALGKVTVRLSVGERKKEFLLEGDSWQELHLELSDDPPPIIEALIITDRTRVPAQLGLSEDGRELGVKVRRISLL